MAALATTGQRGGNMQWRALTAGTALAATIILQGATSPAGQPTDEEVRQLYVKYLSDTPSCRSIGLGELNVVHSGEIDYPHHRINATEFREIQSWAKLGLVTTAVKQLALSYAMVSGIDGIVNVTSTDAGRRISQHDAPSCAHFFSTVYGNYTGGALYLIAANNELERLVNVKYLERNADDYLVIKAIVDKQYTEVGTQLYEIVSFTPPDKVKIVDLFKIDSFTGHWDFVTADVAELSAEFSTANVDSYLSH